ncbi:hypothetical protein [Streptomyces sp. NPDC049585]|uniref:hypothetical protein n=1 Tax=Streptomyces sp. NPDC049585 TaxID=3155154 RepID=UPI003439A851
MRAGFDPARMHRPFRSIGIAAEHESPENPDGSEDRVALTPGGVAALVAHGCRVSVERGAGAGTGYPDAAYAAVGARIESRDALYPGKDLVVKLKGPAHHDLARMDPGSSLLCMAHVRSLPQRAAIAGERGVNLIAMELVRECPEFVSDEFLRSRLAARRWFAQLPVADPSRLSVAFIGHSLRAFGALQYAARTRPRSLRILHAPPPPGPDTVSVEFAELDEMAARLSVEEVDRDRAHHRLQAYGRRRIECLHETGRAGARFGIALALRQNPALGTPARIRTAVLGYGNVAFGALDECARHGVAHVEILTKRTTTRPDVCHHLHASDLVINGAEPADRRRTGYVITEADLGGVLRPGTVVVDLVGGCATNRSVVEPLVECTHPGDPYLVRKGVFLAAVWGWPLLGFKRESVERYSDQITAVLLHEERLADGLATAPPGVLRAVVAGPMLSLRPSSQQMALSATLGG